jgi:haloalkane dehalogenase
LRSITITASFAGTNSYIADIGGRQPMKVEEFVSRNQVIMVLHDWGSLLGFDWTRQHPDRVQGIAYMEAIVQPITWTDWPEDARSIFQGFRGKEGEMMVLEKNLFVESVLPGAILRKLSDEEMAAYRAPFVNAGEDRRPTLTWPRQIPIEGEPPEVVRVANDCGRWLAESRIPKLFINAEPGAILTGRQREFCRTSGLC